MFGGRTHYGRVEKRGGSFEVAALAEAPEEDLGFRLEQMGTTNMDAASQDLEFEPMPLSAAELLPPVTPSKIVCVGRNYREHAREMGNELPTEPLLFSSRLRRF